MPSSGRVHIASIGLGFVPSSGGFWHEFKDGKRRAFAVRKERNESNHILNLYIPFICAVIYWGFWGIPVREMDLSEDPK